MHGIPHFAISIGLERDGQLVAGVIFNPVTDDLYYAEKGHGAYLNNKRLRVAERKELAPSLVRHRPALPGPARAMPAPWPRSAAVMAVDLRHPPLRRRLARHGLCRGGPL